MPEAPQWARVRGEVNCHVRRGAWYEVLRVTPEDVILDVNRQPVRLERAALEIVPLRPPRRSAAGRPPDPLLPAESRGARYLVAPGRRPRQALLAQPAPLPC